MIKNLLRIISIPFVYYFLILQFLFKWIIAAPIIYILYLFKRTFWIAIIGVAISVFFTPLVGGIVFLIGMLFFISSAAQEMSDGFWGGWHINWKYTSDVLLKNKLAINERKRKKLVAKANKEYQKAKDEFDGFDAVSGIYSK